MFEYVTGWNHGYDDFYWNGEMTSWQRVAFPMAGKVVFKFVDGGSQSRYFAVRLSGRILQIPAT